MKKKETELVVEVETGLDHELVIKQVKFNGVPEYTIMFTVDSDAGAEASLSGIISVEALSDLVKQIKENILDKIGN